MPPTNPTPRKPSTRSRARRAVVDADRRIILALYGLDPEMKLSSEGVTYSPTCFAFHVHRRIEAIEAVALAEQAWHQAIARLRETDPAITRALRNLRRQLEARFHHGAPELEAFGFPQREPCDSSEPRGPGKGSEERVRRRQSDRGPDSVEVRATDPKHRLTNHPVHEPNPEPETPTRP